jgi:hypothetical protein
MQFWSTKARQGHPLHRVCAYQGCFPPQLPAFFLDRYPEAEVVLDPFSGRGTTVLEANLRGKRVLAADLLPVARLLSRVKLLCPARGDVLNELDEADLSSAAEVPPEDFAPFYAPETWGQLLRLRKAKRSDALTALALGRLHGHSPGFFSAVTFNVISLRGARVRKLQEKHGTGPAPRDVRKILEKAAEHFLPETALTPRAGSEVVTASATALPERWVSSVDLVITSPPFLDVIAYDEVNWLRGWFLGEEVPELAMHASIEAYRRFLRRVMGQLARVVKVGGRVVFEVGPVTRSERLVDLVLASAGDAEDFVLEEVVTNTFAAAELEGASVPKISRAMYAGKETKTTANQCAVFLRV